MSKSKEQKDYYSNLKMRLEHCRSNYTYRHDNASSIADKICWCWEFRKITKEQMEELADEATKIFNLMSKEC